MQISAPLNHDPVPALQKIEVASSLQIPSFHIVGLPNPEVAEARERIRAAIEASGFEFPRRRVVLNLSPASIRKRGTGIDLAMALAILDSEQQTSPPFKLVAWGELGLDGSIKASGQITRVIYSAWQDQSDLVFVPKSEIDAALKALQEISRSKIFRNRPPILIAAERLEDCWQSILEMFGTKSLPKQDGSQFREAGTAEPGVCAAGLLPLRPYLERILSIAAAGNHHLLLLGPRGTGKTHATEWLVALQPEPDRRIILKNLLISELRSGENFPITQRAPVRRVSVQARPAALLGTAMAGAVRPGEYSLAHGGLLIADEFPEWSRDSRETLRDPLESGRVLLTRTGGSAELPARFTLVANGNLCPCGGWPPDLPLPATAQGVSKLRCKCSLKNRSAYLSRLAGPVLDRLDLVSLVLPEPNTEKARPQEFQVEKRLPILRDKIQRTSDFAMATWGAAPGQLPAAELERVLRNTPAWVGSKYDNADGSLRSRHKIARVALTLAAWDGKRLPELVHFTEAECYRPEAYGLFS